MLLFYSVLLCNLIHSNSGCTLLLVMAGPGRRAQRVTLSVCLSVCLFPKIVMSPPVGKGAISVAFVRPSVAYIANYSRTQWPNVPKFRTNVPHLRCDSHTSFKVKRSQVKVTRPTNAHTHRAPHLLNGKAYELRTWYTDGERRPASATGAMTSNVKGQGHKVT